MDWNFSFSWVFIGLIIVIIGGIMVAKYQEISTNFLSGVSSYERVKFWGLIAILLGLIVMSYLHIFLLTLFVQAVFKR
ncbi:hypothetical protein MBN09_02395 [Candidatus Saccharibacteria bacterium]|nr:hypothetical protein [Candidatus Saccharibacteria bacterium]